MKTAFEPIKSIDAPYKEWMIQDKPKDSTKFVFILPEDYASPTGGNIYNGSLINALSNNGGDTDICDLHSFLSRQKTWEDCIVFIDTLYLNSLTEEMLNNIFYPTFLIVHHLPSLEPGISEDERKEIVERENGLFSCFDGFLVTSEFSRQVLIERGFIHTPIMVVKPALRFKPAVLYREMNGVDGLIVGNLIRRKGVLEFLGALSKHARKNDRFKIRILGGTDAEPAYTGACKEFVQNDQVLIDKVDFLGQHPKKILECFYTISNLFLSPSKMETYGMAVADAATFGLPILGLDAGNVKNHIAQGLNGLVFQNIETMADRFLDIAREPELLDPLLNGAESIVSRKTYTWRDASEKFKSEFEKFKSKF